MKPQLIIWGAGGHAKVVYDTARALGYTEIKFIDDAARQGSKLFDCPIEPPPAEEQMLDSDTEFVIAIGDNRARAECFSRGLRMGWKPATLIHPTALVSANSKVAPGSVVLPRAVINASSGIGWNCIVNTGAVIEHDCHVSDHAHISPSATLGGSVTVDAFAHVGTGASVLPGVRIGKSTIVGAGAVVLKSIPDKVTAVGVPACVLRKPSTQPAIADAAKPKQRILLSVPHMGGQEMQFVEEAFTSNWLSTAGPNITAFEQEFGEHLGVNAVAVASGTAAIHLGLRALGVGPGDTVFCSDLTFVASVNPVQYLGATPVFIDSERDSWNMDPGLLTAALRKAASRNALPKAVIVVHLFGQCADMDPILEACARYGVPVLEDAAEALGASYRDRPTGTLGDVAAFSFNGNKIITTTGGGMLVSKNQHLIAKARFWATQARDPGVAYNHSELGYNYRLSNVLAGIGRGQLRVLNERVAQRRAIALRYADAFADLPGITLMPQAPYGTHTNWLSCFLIDEHKFGRSRDEVIKHLDEAGIESRPVWKPMHMQALYASAEVYGGKFGEELFRCGICLPSSSSLSPADQGYVIQQVRSICGSLFEVRPAAGAVMPQYI